MKESVHVGIMMILMELHLAGNLLEPVPLSFRFEQKIRFATVFLY